MGKDFKLSTDDLQILITSINEPDYTWKSCKEFKPVGKIKTNIDNDEKACKITSSIIDKLQEVGRNGSV